MRSRKSDFILNTITYLCSSISIVVLLTIIIFIFSKGIKMINWDLLVNDYQTKNYLVTLKKSDKGTYPKPNNLNELVYWSNNWGVGVVDYIAQDGGNYILIEKIANDSPFLELIDRDNQKVSLETGSALIRLNYFDIENKINYAGSQLDQTALEFINSLDKAEGIESLYFQTLGGGIRGSLIATLWLILIALLIVLPVGLATAIYLNEYAKKNRFSRMLRYSIETLSGVPSIIFGLMGVAVFYPVTTIFGANGLSILLGGMTMSVVLLPTVIRATQEAFLVVPQELKDGSLALGANLSQTIFKIIIPYALPGILTGVLLSVGRIIGESAALIYTMGTFANDYPKVLNSGSSLAVHIWSIMSGEQPNFELAAGISIVILVTIFILNFIVKFVSKKVVKVGS